MSKVLGIGLDLCEISRMEALLADERFLRRCFTDAERTYILSRGLSAGQTMAGMWAAKEALLKALGTGISLPLTDIEILHTESGQPHYHLTGRALEASRGGTFLLTITHEALMAAAVCLWEE